MGAPVALRHLPADELRRLARQESNGRVACRLIALANALDGMSREQAARQAGMDRQTLRDWVIRFNAAGLEGLRDRPKSGRPSWLDDGDLCRLVATRFGVVDSENGMLRLLHDLGLSWQKARPIHPQADPAAQARFEKKSPA